MDRRTRDQVAELSRLFLVYDAIEQRARARQLDAAEVTGATLILRDLSFRSWERVFGPALSTPPHRRFTLEWCRRNAELLMKEQVLPVIAHQVVVDHIESQLAGLATDAAYDFSHHGPPGSAGTALRRLYLIQSLTILFEELGGSGRIPPRLHGQLRRHLIRHVKSLFTQALGDEGVGPAGPHLLESYVRQGALAPEAAERLAAAMGVKLAPPAAAAPADLLEVAAAAEMMRRLRRAPALSAPERDRLVRRLETELEGLIQNLDTRTLQGALQSVAARVGIPVPPVPAPGGTDDSASRLLPRASRASPDSSDFQWAFDLIADLRRETVEEEK